MNMKKELPFKVDRALPKSLTQQVVDGFVRAIEFGVYKPGGLLPPFREVAERAGVSEIVARAAFRKLGQLGYVNPRLGIGTIVLERNTLWKGQVLIIGFDTVSDYFHDTINGIVRANLLKAGYLPLQVSVVKDAKGALDLKPLEVVLRQSFSLVVVHGCNEQVVRYLVSRSTPFVCAGARAAHDVGAVGTFRIMTAHAIADLVRSCRTAGVRRVCEVRFDDRSLVQTMFEEAGIGVSVCRLPHPKGMVSYSEFQKHAFAAFERIFYRKGWSLPELIYASDDYVASAVLYSLRQHCIGVPEDVKFVSWINRGAGPFFPGTLARFEADPFRFGDELSGYILSLMSGKRVPPVLDLCCTFVPGDTFPA